MIDDYMPEVDKEASAKFSGLVDIIDNTYKNSDDLFRFLELFALTLLTNDMRWDEVEANRNFSLFVSRLRLVLSATYTPNSKPN